MLVVPCVIHISFDVVEAPPGLGNVDESIF